MHVLRITARNQDAGVRPVHPVERPERAQAAVLNGILRHAGVPGDPPREVMRGIEVHQDLILEAGGPLPIGQSRRLPDPVDRLEKTWNGADFIPDFASAPESGNNAAAAGVFIGRRLARNRRPNAADPQVNHTTRRGTPWTSKTFDRRDFLKLAGLGGVVLVSGCASTAFKGGGMAAADDDFYFVAALGLPTGASRAPPSIRMRRER